MTATDAAVDLSLPDTISFETTIALAAEMREVSADAPLRIDAGAVVQMCTPFVLTLVAALNARAETGAKVVVLNPTGAFTDAFTDLGLFSDMMKMEFAT